MCYVLGILITLILVIVIFIIRNWKSFVYYILEKDHLNFFLFFAWVIFLSYLCGKLLLIYLCKI